MCILECMAPFDRSAIPPFCTHHHITSFSAVIEHVHYSGHVTRVSSHCRAMMQTRRLDFLVCQFHCWRANFACIDIERPLLVEAGCSWLSHDFIKATECAQRTVTNFENFYGTLTACSRRGMTRLVHTGMTQSRGNVEPRSTLHLKPSTTPWRPLAHSFKKPRIGLCFQNKRQNERALMIAHSNRIRVTNIH